MPLRRLALLLLALVLLLPAYLPALNASPGPAAQAIRREIADGPAVLTRERAMCARAGLPITLSQLNQTVPPAENAAPLYVQWDKLRKAKPLPLPRFALATWPMDSHFAYTSAQYAEVSSLFDARPDYTGLIDRANDRPRCIFVTDWTKFPNMDNSTYAGALREAARTYSTRSYLLAKQGHFAEAVTMQARGFVVARQAADADPDSVGFQVASEIDSITACGMRDVLQLAGPNAAVDAQVQTALAAAPRFSLGESLRGEGAILDGLVAALRRTPPDDNAPFTPAEQRSVNVLWDPAEAVALAQIRGLFRAAALPRAARNAAFVRLCAKPKGTSYDPRFVGTELGSRRILAAIAGNTGKDLGDQMDSIPARHVVLAAGTVLLAAKAQTGAFPETLPAGFMDPYTDKPLGYRREGANGFVVYSVGPTGKFSGGKPGEWPILDQIVFRYPPPPPLPLPAEVLK